MLACGERGAMVMTPPTRHDSAVSPCFHGCLAFLHRHFPPRSPLSHPFDQSLHSQQKPSPWDCSTIPKLQLPAPAPSRRPAFLSGECMAVARTVWFSFHLGCHRSAVSLSALNVSPLTQTIAQMWGSGPLLQFPHPLRAGPILLTLLFFPLVLSSYWVLHGSIYFFPLVRSSWPLSAGVLRALLRLKVYSWCIRGERCTPHPPTPPPSCSPFFFFLNKAALNELNSEQFSSKKAVMIYAVRTKITTKPVFVNDPTQNKTAVKLQGNNT